MLRTKKPPIGRLFQRLQQYEQDADAQADIQPEAGAAGGEGGEAHAQRSQFGADERRGWAACS